jgi:hypothetical protein
VRVAVQPHNRQASQFSAEIITDPRNPGPIDEAEINVRVGAKSLDQLGRRMFQGFRVGSERLRSVCCHRHSDERKYAGKPSDRQRPVVQDDAFANRGCHAGEFLDWNVNARARS